ncbi:glycine cleavage system aminomethyltransferase GcvT [bacterium]|nr:glycine cleavage system aminomethyltransferase GcvT [bacterium]
METTEKSGQPLKTPLYARHIAAGARMGDFAGWVLPLWYPTGQSAEHMAVRKACGLFDICHMGEFRISGPAAVRFLTGLLTNRVDQAAHGQAMYHFMLNESGGVIDDCILYRFGADDFMLVVNAGNIDADLAWIRTRAADFDCSVEDRSPFLAKLDLQGPASPALMSRFIPKSALAELKYFRFLPSVSIGGIDVLLSRTGYTGEIGFELYAESSRAEALWDLLLSEGKPHGILACGLGSRDTLRVEAGLPLHGHELRPDRPAIGHPWEFAMRADRDFFGGRALAAGRPTDRWILPFSMNGRRKAMPGWEVLQEGVTIGFVLSGVISPSLNNMPIGFLESTRPLDNGVPLGFRQPETGTLLEGRIVPIPFVSLTARRKMAEFLT